MSKSHALLLNYLPRPLCNITKDYLLPKYPTVGLRTLLCNSEPAVQDFFVDAEFEQAEKLAERGLILLNRIAQTSTPSIELKLDMKLSHKERFDQARQQVDCNQWFYDLLTTS